MVAGTIRHVPAPAMTSAAVGRAFTDRAVHSRVQAPFRGPRMQPAGWQHSAGKQSAFFWHSVTAGETGTVLPAGRTRESRPVPGSCHTACHRLQGYDDREECEMSGLHE